MAVSKLTLIMVVALASMMNHFQTTGAQTTHVVGGTLGWGVNPASAYTAWASGQNFTVGDSLLFNFATNAHNVAEVAEGAYAPCNATAPMSLEATGPATVNLMRAGGHYYICTVGPHCQLGQKLTINVTAMSSSTPAPAGSTTPPPPGATMTPPAPRNASPSLTTVTPMVTFLVGCFVAALFY